MSERPPVTPEQWADAAVIWDHHHMGHRVRPCSVAIGLGGHDPGVAGCAAVLYHRGMFPLIVFTGATSPTTAARFPRGEAVHFREHALALGVPDEAILVEPRARNTGENIAFSRTLLRERGITPESVMLVSKPYAERRAYATCRRQWPEVEVVCASAPPPLREYARTIGDDHLVIDMLVGDLQRIIEYPKRGFAIPQHVPEPVLAAYRRLVAAGFDTRLITA